VDHTHQRWHLGSERNRESLQFIPFVGINAATTSRFQSAEFHSLNDIGHWTTFSLTEFPLSLQFMVFTADLVKLRLTQFTLFPTLPVELRLKIWTIASFHPQNVDIWARCLGEIGSRLHPYIPFKYTSHCSVPAILHVCRESRGIGLQYYHLDFGTLYDDETFRFETPPKIYIHFAADRVCELSGSDNNSPVICEYFISKCCNNGAQSVALRLSSMLDGDSEPLLDIKTARFGEALRWKKSSSLFLGKTWIWMARLSLTRSRISQRLITRLSFFWTEHKFYFGEGLIRIGMAGLLLWIN
jgi:hypothetical protein